MTYRISYLWSTSLLHKGLKGPKRKPSRTELWCPEAPSEVATFAAPAVEKLQLGLPADRPRIPPCAGHVSQARLVEEKDEVLTRWAHTQQRQTHTEGSLCARGGDVGRKTSARELLRTPTASVTAMGTCTPLKIRRAFPISITAGCF